jgi:DNA modification methylase
LDTPTYLPTDTIITGEAIAAMTGFPDKSIDLILCDPPYGTTDCAWDKLLPMKELWEQYKRIIKPNAAILLFAQQPFATALISAAGKLFRYQIVWEKATAVGFLNANRMPLRAHELILVFYNRLPAYHPQMSPGKPYVTKDIRRSRCAVYRHNRRIPTVNKGWRYPRDIIKFAQPSAAEGRYHPTQKPLALLEYLIKTYSNPGDVVLDNCCGSGSTCAAAVNTGRKYIGIEFDAEFANIAAARVGLAAGEAHDDLS